MTNVVLKDSNKIKPVQEILLRKRDYYWGSLYVYIQLYDLNKAVSSIEDLEISVELKQSEKTDDLGTFHMFSVVLEGDGIQTAVRVEAVPASTERFQTLSPGLWYWGNRFTKASAPSKRMSNCWSFREDRLSIPVVSALTDSALIALFDTRLPEKDESLASVVSPDQMQIGSFSLCEDKKQRCIGYRRPYREMPESYVSKHTFSEPVICKMQLKKGEHLTLEITVCALRVDEKITEYDQLNWINRVAEKLYAHNPPDRTLTEQQIMEIMKQYYSQTFFTTKTGISGFVGKEMDTFSSDLGEKECEVGFIGRVLLNAAFCLEYGLEHKHQEYINYGVSIIDSFILAATESSWLRESYIGSEQRWKGQEQLFLRRQAEGALAVYQAYKVAERYGIKKPVWYEIARKISENICSIQIIEKNENEGSIPFSFDYSSNPLDNRTVSTPSTVPLLAIFNPDRAVLAGDFILRTMVKDIAFHSSSLDSYCEDKESGIIVLSALCCLHRMTEESKWLDAAKKTAEYVLSWYYCWDVPLPLNSLLGSISFKTSGWGNVSVENNHIDCYLFDLPQNLIYLSDQTGDGFFRKQADFLSDSIVERLLERDGHSTGISLKGCIPEVVQHTAWNYGTGTKGSYNNISAFGWTHASIWEVIRERLHTQRLI